MGKQKFQTDIPVKDLVSLLGANICQRAEIVTQYGVRYQGHLSCVDFGKQHWPDAYVAVSVDDKSPSVVSGRQFQVTLLKKSLRQITDKEFLHCLKIAGKAEWDNPSKIWRGGLSIGYTPKKGKGIYFLLMDDGAIEFCPSESQQRQHVPGHLAILQYLHEQGYALPWKGTPIDELVECGIYRLV